MASLRAADAGLLTDSLGQRYMLSVTVCILSCLLSGSHC